ncbi:MAG: hypothetical protein CSYNP_01078 [Syntrophus sp. SKADARSKE-3]|nr:hypothetical protein [Syntrophus sp. SKADARSKE-3]
MNGQNWIIEHPCPQCGGPVDLEETDHLLTCTFCRTSLYIDAPRHFRYFIPPCKSLSRHLSENVLFMPYWRIRGLTYAFEPLAMTNRYIDTNLSAMAANGIPPSTGLRPQAMRLKYAIPEAEGQFLKPQRTLYDVMPETDRSAIVNHHTLFIGETVSIIYAPMTISQDTLYDAVLQRPVAKCFMDAQNPWEYETAGMEIRFIPTLCPQCGWDLKGESEALVLMCSNCQTAWMCKDGGFHQAPFTVVKGASDSLAYLPFWKITAHITGIKASSYADFVHLANLPRIVTAAMEDQPLRFWSPAFKVNPALFLRWSRQMTTLQPEDDLPAGLPACGTYPVTLPVEEALENILVILGHTMTDKRAFFKALPDIHIVLKESLLVFQPFIIGSRELTHEKMGIVIEKNALRYGSSM